MMSVESAVVLVLLVNSAIVKDISGIVKIHLYVMVVLVLMIVEDVVQDQIAVSQLDTVIVMDT